MNKIKKISVENILEIFIIICPILDSLSFIFRNMLNVNFSPATIIRAVVPVILLIYLFFKNDKKFKKDMIIIGITYLIYGIIHLYLFQTTITKSSYSNIIHEAQYIVNYTFLIINLINFLYIFSKDKKCFEKLSKSILISNMIYIGLIYLSIFTKTSSNTYIEEKIGYKGWFESGNSLGTILILSLFIIILNIKNKKYRKIVIPFLILDGIFLTILLGTRTGLVGFILVLMIYFIVDLIYGIFKNKEKIKKKIVIGIATISIIVLGVMAVGSATIQRRKHLHDIEKNIFDETKKQEAHITGDLMDIRDKIVNKNLEEGYMNEPQKKSILELYDIANKLEIKNNDQRSQQLIYNYLLAKNQKDFRYILFGNGYMANFRELILEMEIPAFLFNFGIYGFILYFVPFLLIFIVGLIEGIKNIKKIDKEYIILEIACGFTFLLSFFAGYTFFNSSSMIIIVTINTMLVNKIYLLRKGNNK